MNARSVIWIHCRACGRGGLAIMAGPVPWTEVQCDRCGVVGECGEREVTTAYSDMARRFVNMLPERAQLQEACTCSRDAEGLPELHAKSCPLFKEFWSHYQAAREAIYGEQTD